MMSDLAEVTQRIDLAPPVTTHTCEDGQFANPLPDFIKVVEFVSKQLLIGDSAKSHGVIRTGHPDPVGAAPGRGEGEGQAIVGGGDEEGGESESTDYDTQEGGDDDDEGGHLECGNEPTQPLEFFADGEAEDEVDGAADDDGPRVIDPNTFDW